MHEPAAWSEARCQAETGAWLQAQREKRKLDLVSLPSFFSPLPFIEKR